MKFKSIADVYVEDMGIGNMMSNGQSTTIELVPNKQPINVINELIIALKGINAQSLTPEQQGAIRQAYQVLCTRT